MTVPSADCLAGFGAIIYWYAQVEFGVKSVLAGVLDIHMYDMMILAEPYSAANLRNVAKSIVKDSAMNKANQTIFIGLVGEFGTFGTIRNTVAHRRWTAGTRPGSIRAVGLDIRSGAAKSLGLDPSEKDYLAADLFAQAEKLIELNLRFVRFIQTSGLEARIDAKMAEAIQSLD